MARIYTKSLNVPLSEPQRSDLDLLVLIDGTDAAKIMRAALDDYRRKRRRDLLAARQDSTTASEAKTETDHAA